MNRLEKSILSLLGKRKENGLWQSEIESISGYSKSHLSETIGEMERKNFVIRRKEGNILNRVWIPLYFPGIVEGTVRAGVLKSSEYLPALNVLEKICRERSIALKVRIFHSSVDMLESLYSRSIEIAMAPSVTQIIYASIRGDLHIISSIASGGSAIYENVISNSKYCSGSEISTMTFMTKKFLSSHQDIAYLPYSSLEKGIEAFLSGKVRFIAAWEPYCRFLESHENVRKVAGYRDLLDEMPCCLMSCTGWSLGHYGEIFHEFTRQYDKFCSSTPYDGDLLTDNHNIFEKKFAGNIRDSMNEYSFCCRTNTEVIGKIAAENGILVSSVKLESWMSEFFIPV